MVASEVDGSPSPPDVKVLAQVDMHRFLRAPDGLAELLSEFDCTEAAQIVDDLAAHLRSATHVDAAGLIDQLALLCAEGDKPRQWSIRTLNCSVVAFVVDCMRFVAANDTEFVLVEFVSTASLDCGYDVLLRIGWAHRSTRTHPSGDAGNHERYLATTKVVGHAMEIWRQRATRAIEYRLLDGGGNPSLFSLRDYTAA